MVAALSPRPVPQTARDGTRNPSFESTPGTLVLTYTCNAFDFRTLISDMSIYRPILTQLRMP